MHCLGFQLFDMLEHTNARLDALDQRMSSGTQTGVSDSLPPEDDEEERAARAALHNLLFPDLPMDIPLFGSGPYATPPRSQFRASQNPAHISDLRTEERTIGQCEPRQLLGWALRSRRWAHQSPRPFTSSLQPLKQALQEAPGLMLPAPALGLLLKKL
jgi:hypothetical protein